MQAPAAAAASPSITVRGPSRAVVQLGMKAGRSPGDACPAFRVVSKLARANFEAGAAARRRLTGVVKLPVGLH